MFVQSFDEEVKCTECGKTCTRLFSGEIAFQFKGFGFPTNDSKLFATPPDAEEKLRDASLKKNNMDVTE